jgi:hypothetical protein
MCFFSKKKRNEVWELAHEWFVDSNANKLEKGGKHIVNIFSNFNEGGDEDGE